MASEPKGGAKVLRSLSAFSKVLAVVAIAVAATGCATKKLQQENDQLRSQVTNLQSELEFTKAENARLQEQMAGVETDLGKTRADLEAARKKLAGQGITASVSDQGLVITMPVQILYASGSATLATKGKEQLKTIAKTLNEDLKGYPVEVQGHTDNDPIRQTKDRYKSNWELSYDRAQTVAYYLISGAGVDPKRIHAAAYGEYHPVAANTSAEGKAKNRRVEIVIHLL